VVSAGTTIFIIVGTYMDNMNPGDGGAFEITVTETAPLAPGAACDVFAQPDICPSTQSCTGRGQVGTCTDLGTATLTRCRPMTDPNGQCDAGLTCDTQSGLCLTTATVGGACDFIQDICPTGSFCRPNISTTTPELTQGICAADGSLGGFCDGTTACTDTTNTCSDPTNGGFCQASGAANAACQPSLAPPVLCTTGTTCAQQGTSFKCLSDGTAAGTACRDTAPRCDAALVCSGGATGTAAGICQTAAVTTCNPRLSSAKCTVAGQVCAAKSFITGTCTTSTAESTADHSTFDTAQNTTGALSAFTGSLAAATDVDCYKVTVTQGQSIYAEVSDGAGGCPANADTIITLINSAGQVIESNDDSGLNFCSILDGSATNSLAGNLDAGTYAVCVRPFPQTTVDSYVLSISVQ
jgi:hypothetical protein